MPAAQMKCRKASFERSGSQGLFTKWLGANKAGKVFQTPHEHKEEGAFKCPK